MLLGGSYCHLNLYSNHARLDLDRSIYLASLSALCAVCGLVSVSRAAAEVLTPAPHGSQNRYPGQGLTCQSARLQTVLSLSPNYPSSRYRDLVILTQR